MNALIRLKRFGLASSLALASLLAGCGGTGGGAGLDGTAAASGCIPGDTATAADCGSVVIALTDAAGDFMSYTVDVLSIALVRSDGTSVEVLPQTARIDFAELSSLSELVTQAVVQPGEFVGGRIRIDYGDAEIFVESGGDIVPALVYDSAGTLLTTPSADSIVDVEIQLPDNDRLVVGRGRTSLLGIDFDLAASNVVDTSTNPATAVARPYLVAEVDPVTTKEFRLRGALIDVDLAAGSYRVHVRPHYHLGGDYGALDVATGAETEFEIDGVSLTGRAGLEALAALPQGTPTEAFGSLNLSDRSFGARLVHAGGSVGGVQYSAVLGNIVARAGDELVVKGGIAVRRDHRAHFQRTVVVTVGPATLVTKQGRSDALLDKDALSVGQRVQIFGRFTNPGVDDSDPFGPDVALLMDASEGRARMLPTRLSGSLVSANPGTIVMSLRAIDRLGVALFDFSGTGIAAELDADPQAYTVSTSTLALEALIPDRPLRITGFVAPFAAAPPDFEGLALLGSDDLPATLGIDWGTSGTTAAFSAINATGLVVDLANTEIGDRHHVLIGDELIDLFSLPASPAIVASDRPRVYGIALPGRIELHRDFAGFVDALALHLSAAEQARALGAYGHYTESDNTLHANRVVVQLLPAPTP